MSMELKACVTIVIPDDLRFSDLHMRQEADGNIYFEWAVIERICEASGMPVGAFKYGPEENVVGLVFSWYMKHREQGGEPDPIAEGLVAEVEADNADWQRSTITPGHA